MTLKHGRLGELWLNGVDVSVYFASADMSTKQATADVTVFKASWKSYLAGLAESTVTAAGFYDSSEADKVRSTLQAAVGQLTFSPAGAVAIGDLARLVNINSSDYKTGSKIGAAITMDWTALSTTTVGIGYVLAPLGTISATTTSASHDDLASTATGWIAHLHATAVTGGSTWVFQIQDSADNASFANVGTAFTSVAAAGSQRLVTTGTIRRYVRYIATITGAGNLTFGLAIART